MWCIGLSPKRYCKLGLWLMFSLPGGVGRFCLADLINYLSLSGMCLQIVLSLLSLFRRTRIKSVLDHLDAAFRKINHIIGEWSGAPGCGHRNSQGSGNCQNPDTPSKNLFRLSGPALLE